ncbi:MAG: hypothetical protein RQ745_11230 [Longimicrobiales bacterium]|nr:hypothetical protein [Longimicrobiales bacterium]
MTIDPAIHPRPLPLRADEPASRPPRPGRRPRRSRRARLTAGLLLLAACTAAPADPVAEATELGVPRVAAPLPGVITAAQPSQAQVDELRSRGYRNFISLRLPTESGAGWEETHLPAAGSNFARIPISGADDLTRENVEALDDLLDDAEGETTLLYCASSNRVGALLALRAFWFEGADADAALALGREAGLMGLEPAVREILAEGR